MRNHAFHDANPYFPRHEGPRQLALRMAASCRGPPRMAATKALGDPDGAHDDPDVVHEAPDLSSEKHPDAVEQRYRKEGGTT